ncbi:hypothetical protein ACOSZF_13585 [Cytobacillus firmus]|uniref:Uncharacterized protein n=1 Tax=Cytobacillus firmus TaxID=1399 RepID=A0A800MVU7_CYTFI|nr:hypothetical protein [Cytobacillus firmus]KAF0823230.1 hypothetical protein KIS1582_2951 [Cytobacillus firmus]MDD9312252.1 hypothetical protein [Cytobacillus firmus]MEC1895161.1 hypothetical protein [Cytobacillus firmus]MED1905107.1 hypothetical protein [Cytobacillus firmus]MED1940038.1 hypothetical protein [Cytobacillus firmus]
MNETKKLVSAIQSEAGSLSDPSWFDRINRWPAWMWANIFSVFCNS